MPGPGAPQPGSLGALPASERRERSLRALILPFVGAHRRPLGLMAATSTVGGFAEAGVLVIIARVAFAVVDRDTQVDLTRGPVTVTVSVPAMIAVTAGLVVLRFALNVVQARLTARTTTRVLADVRTGMIQAYLDAGWPLQAADREGRLQELVTTYASAAPNTVLSLSQGLVAAFNFLAFVLTALLVSPIAAASVAAVALAIALVLRPLRGQVRRRSRRASQANLEYATAVTEMAATTQEIRIFGVAGPVGDRLESLAEEVAARQLRTRFLSSLLPSLYQGVVLMLAVVGLAFVYAVGVDDLSALGGVSLLMLRSLTYGQSMQTALQSLHENAPYFELLEEEEARYRDAKVTHGGVPVECIGALAFDDVAFAYQPGRPVLEDVSFTVDHGEIVGIVGPSGAGKSTLVQLLLRLREPGAGRVLVDGRDARDLDLDEWYGHVAFVPQQAQLFAGSIADNIAFFRSGIDRDAIERAARRAHVHDDIAALPHGYDTPAGERGGELSGGQRQRICIARALVTEPELVVLDEPTSALDAKSEALMRETLAGLAPDATVFVIAHRLSTLSVCQRIMVVHQGTVQHFDEPERLERDNPFYREVLLLSGLR